MSLNDWTKDEENILATGIDGGLSWSTIGRMLPRRRGESVRIKARKLGLVHYHPGPWPQIRDEDDNVIDDPLLAALQAEHVTGTGEHRIPSGPAQFVGLPFERSLTGSPCLSVVEC